MFPPAFGHREVSRIEDNLRRISAGRILEQHKPRFDQGLQQSQGYSDRHAVLNKMGDALRQLRLNSSLVLTTNAVSVVKSWILQCERLGEFIDRDFPA